MNIDAVELNQKQREVLLALLDDHKEELNDVIGSPDEEPWHSLRLQSVEELTKLLR